MQNDELTSARSSSAAAPLHRRRRGHALVLAVIVALLGSVLTPAADIAVNVAFGQTHAPGTAPSRTVVVGRTGDRWLDTMQHSELRRAAQGNTYGYNVTYDIAGFGKLLLFWPRDRIDLRGSAPPFRLEVRPLGIWRLWYPDKITAASLPAVYREIIRIESEITRDADGAIAAMEGFANVATLGMGTPTVRTPLPRVAPRGPVPLPMPRVVPRAPLPAPRPVLPAPAPSIAAAPAAAASVGTHVAGRGFRTFAAFKKAMGSAGEGMQWHHVVEQGGGNVARFGAETVHNTANIVRLEVATHRAVSALYSRKFRRLTGSATLTVRQWLRSQSFEAQQAFGRQAIENVKAKIW